MTTFAGEHLDCGIQPAHILARDEAMVLMATDEFSDTSLGKGTSKTGKLDIRQLD